MTNSDRKLIVAISGASGVVYGMEMLKVLKDLGVKTHVVVSHAAEQNFSIETSYTMDAVRDVATWVHDENALAEPIASGSFSTMGMIVIPCSIKTLSGIANCFATNLLIRAADVTLKEKRPLVLVVRETPLHEGHLKLMLSAASMGAVILPPGSGILPRIPRPSKTSSDIPWKGPGQSPHSPYVVQAVGERMNRSCIRSI